MLTRRVTIAVVTAAAFVLAACDEGAPSVTAEVTAAGQGEVCIRVEDQETWGRLNGCYPRPKDSVTLEVGDCIRARVPSPDVPEDRGKPLRDVERLDRDCKR